MAYVITCGDEGIQINEGTRLGILGAGLNLDGADKVIKLLKKLFGNKLRITANAENEWVKDEFKLDTFQDADATMQQQVEAFADKNKILYAGFIPFADPKELKHDIKGHMVRPKGIHIANKISFTCAGGEQTFHLGHYQISAEWVADADKKFVKEFIGKQVEFYNKQAKMELPFVFEMEGELDEKKAKANRQVLEKLGYKE